MKKRKLSTVLTCVFTAGFLISACMVFKTLWDARMEKQAFDALAELVASVPTENPVTQSQSRPDGTLPASDTPETVPPETQYVSPYFPLKERNPDFFGWITIDNTQINYPVMYCPEEPERYLHQNFDGEFSQSGVPFLSADWEEGCGNYLIYGHHMKNGSMFASLTAYADKRYWEEHPLIRFDTLTGPGEYEVLGAFYSRIYEQEATDVFRYYDYTDLSQESVFDAYVKQVKAAALYDTGVEAAYGDQLLSLSTCSYHTEEGRFVVVARRCSP